MNKKKLIRNIILVLAIFVLLIILVTSLADDIDDLFKVIGNAHGLWLLAALGLVLLYAFLYQLSFIILIRKKTKEISFIDLYCISGSEFFFNSITPFSTGGQPFQAYALKRKKFPVSSSISVLLTNFIAYQFTLTIVSLVLIAIYYSRTLDNIGGFISLLLIGFAVNTTILLIAVFIGFCKPFGRFVVYLVDKICNIKFLKKRFGNKKAEVQERVNNMQNTFAIIIKSKRFYFSVLTTKTLSLLIYYAVPVCALYAVGIDLFAMDIPYIVALTSFAVVISTWIPTPGSSGGIEFAFTQLYSPLLEGTYQVGNVQSICLSVMLIWRLITYYFLLLYGFTLYLIFEKRADKADKLNASAEINEASNIDFNENDNA